ncbi:MAG TPA: proline dehydrogenase family protein [Chitinophagaceae bacterium]|nr:proline dehydrogenase family protein [Chitinophagaceae bacterium]
MSISPTVSFDDTQIAFEIRSDQELKKSEWIFSAMKWGWLVSIGSFLTVIALRLRLPVKGIIRKTIFHQFCGGETLEQAGKTAEILGAYRINVILDYGVEGKDGEQTYDRNLAEFLRVIQFASSQPHIPFISIKITGFSRFSLLEKIHQGLPLDGPEASEFERVRDRVRQICRAAHENHLGVLMDAEESWIQIPVDELAVEMMEEFNRDRVTVFNTVQLYRHDRLEYLKDFLEESRQKPWTAGMKLVRGAYMEKERERAEIMHYPSPIQPDKGATDRDYNDSVLYSLARLDQLSLFIATHNEASTRVAIDWMAAHQIPPGHPRVHFSQLYGMSDHLSFNLAKAGYRVSKYLPYGPVREVMPYLIRRAEENRAIGGQMSRELSLIRTEIRRRRMQPG